MCEFVFRYFTINRENEFYCQVCLHIRGICYSDRNMNAGYTFTFMHLADAFIQSDLQYIQVMHVPWELNPQPFVLLTQWSTTEPQETQPAGKHKCLICELVENRVSSGP